MTPDLNPTRPMPRPRSGSAQIPLGNVQAFRSDRSRSSQEAAAPRLTLSRRGGSPLGPLGKEDWTMRLRFASLVLCSRESLTKGLEAVAWDLLGFALLGTARDVQEHLLGCLDAPRRELVRVFMGHLTGIPEQEVTLAQKLILEYIGGAATE